MKTTLNEIREYSPCAYGWHRLLRYLDKTKADDEPLAFTTILESNGILDAAWCLRVRPACDPRVMTFKLKCARRAQFLDPSGKSAKCLDVVERFIKGEASILEVGQARGEISILDLGPAREKVREAVKSTMSGTHAYATAYHAAHAVASACTSCSYEEAYWLEQEYQKWAFLQIFSEED